MFCRMAEKRKKNRRASQIFQDLASSQEALMQNEQIRNLYQNKNFQAPSPRDFETIFEDYRRGLTEDGSLVLGKSLGKRFLETYKYWKQDDRDRVRRRKLMIQKQFKGRRRPKVEQLTASQEEELATLIAGCLQEEEEEDWLHSTLQRLVIFVLFVPFIVRYFEEKIVKLILETLLRHRYGT